ncbi:DUF2875 family protein, partial [Pseudomonas syringae pv. tagetis]
MLGNTALSRPLVHNNQYTIARYNDIGVIALDNARKDGRLTVQIIRPPDEA